ncbi:MAG: YybH family protein [Gemmatimonadaceae bacterium]
MNCSLQSGRSLVLLGACLCLPPVLAAQQSPPTGVSRPATAIRPATDDEQAVARTIAALFAAAERNDLAALDTLYAGERLTVVEGAGINRGWTDYRDHHLAPELREMKNFRYRPFEIESHVAGDMGWAIFRYALQADAGERKVDVVGRGTAVLERSGGRWIIRHTQTSSRARRPTDPPMPTIPTNP